MSTLRDHLDQAKAQHEAARYPGDLAAELLPIGAVQLKPTGKPATSNRWFWVGSSSAVAASLITAFLLASRTAPLSSNGPVNIVPGGSSPIVSNAQVQQVEMTPGADAHGPRSGRGLSNDRPNGPSIGYVSGPSTRNGAQPKISNGDYTPPR